MIGKLATRESGTNRQFKPQIHQSRGRGQNRSYSQRNYQHRYNNRSNSRDRGQYRQDRSRPRYEPRYKQNEKRGNFRGNVRNYGRQKGRGMYRNNYRNAVMAEVRTGPERGHFQDILAIIELEAQAIVDPGQDPELVQIGTEYIVISVGNMIIS